MSDPSKTRDANLRLDIQGLRGIAVLLVVLYHAGVPAVPGGFVGVDVFFVISGYLITGLLVREWARSGKIDYLAFIARRARRLLPASLLLVAFVAVAALRIYPEVERVDVLGAARAAALYVANVFFALDAVDYLGGGGKDNPLLHMWSLGVEEQFYLVWPIVIAWCVRARHAPQARTRLVVTIAGLTAGSFALCLFITWKAQPWAFFGMPTRAWEFGLGALVMLLGPGAGRCTTTTLRAVGALGLLGVVAGAVWLDDTSLFPGAWALLPAGGTALMLLTLHSGTKGLLWRGLTLRPLVRAGDVSYSWYLWHWPLLVMARAVWPEMSDLAVAGVVVVSYLAAEISLRWVEQPVRAGWAARLAPRITVGAAAAATATAAAGLSVGLVNLRDSSGNELQRVFAQAAKDIPVVYAQGCHVPIRATQPQSCTLGDVQAQRTILLFGDSHAAQWVPALDEAARQHNWRLLSMTKSGCPWVDTPIRLGQLRREYAECDAWRKAALDRIGALRPDVIVLANSHHRTYVAPSAWSDGAGKSLAHLAATTPHIVVLSDTVWPGFDVPRCLARAEQRGADLSKACRFDVPSRLQAVRSIHDAEQQAVALAGASWVDPVPSVCPSDPCPVYESGVVHFSDQSHMTASFSRSLSADIWPAIDSELSSVVQAASTPPHLAGGHPPAAADSAGKPLR